MLIRACMAARCGKLVCVGERELNDKRYYSVVFGRADTVDALLPLLHDL